MRTRLRISATEAARNFSDLVNRVYYKGETFVVERGGEPVCEISPASPLRFTGAEFVKLLSGLPRPDHEYFDVIEELNKKQRPLADGNSGCSKSGFLLAL